jgi:hypothetical protein
MQLEMFSPCAPALQAIATRSSRVRGRLRRQPADDLAQRRL